MHVIRLDHATINTADVAASVAFYGHFLGMAPGWRPPFNVGGAWLYPSGGDYPIVHLIEAKRAPDGGMFDHVAFRGEGLAGYLAKVKASGGWYRATPVPGTGLVQIHHRDPNGVLIEVNFEGEPLDPAELRP
jgi:catechol 2,3-dioxygenase-like lactoylglutathione lyase family enzyme